MTAWPDWWEWDVVLSWHMLRRMMDRRFNEVDLRLMLEDASGYHPDCEPGRYVVETRHEGRLWEVILEPEPAGRVVVAVTAYPVE